MTVGIIIFADSVYARRRCSFSDGNNSDDSQQLFVLLYIFYFYFLLFSHFISLFFYLKSRETIASRVRLLFTSTRAGGCGERSRRHRRGPRG